MQKAKALLYVCAGLLCLIPVTASAQAPTYLYQWGSYGSGNGQFDNIGGVAVDASGNVHVTDANNYRIEVFGSLPVPAKSTTWGRIKALYR